MIIDIKIKNKVKTSTFKQTNNTSPLYNMNIDLVLS